ncbi:MAG: GSCFA domain-containing protein, partial [Rhodospirillaceae bacterium]
MSNAYQTCPYNDLPYRAFFKKLSGRNGDIYLEPDPRLSIGPEDKIISAGSCFAARIATFIRTSGLTYLFSDDRVSSEDNEVREESSAIFSLRYGNIYTTRHLAQLLRRVTGKQAIDPPVAQDENRRYRNLFRPSVLSYSSVDVLRADDEAHLSNVKTLLERATVFTFTLGLTEQWIDKETEITFPSAPGCGFGAFDTSKHTFHNSTLPEVVGELRESIDLLREINPKLSIVL